MQIVKEVALSSLSGLKSLALRYRFKNFFFAHFLYIFLVNGGYSNWSLDTPCNVWCGEGVEIWGRVCDNPEPKYGGRNCSDLGNSTDLKKCSKKPCPSKNQSSVYSSYYMMGLSSSSCVKWQKILKNMRL